jgi:hypothetical protein
MTLVRTDVSEERIASLAATSNRRTLPLEGLGKYKINKISY